MHRGRGRFADVSATRLGLSREEYDDRVAAVESAPEEEFWTSYGAAVGATADQLTELRRDFWDAYCGEGNHELLSFAESLIGQAGLAILSNSGDGARREEESRYGFSRIFDPICYSHELGVEKPDPLAFLHALRAMGATPGEVLFVDDHAPNVVTARALGIQAILHQDNAATIGAIRDAVGVLAPEPTL